MSFAQQLLFNAYSLFSSSGGNVSTASSIKTVYHVYTSPGTFQLVLSPPGSPGYFIDPDSFRIVAFGAGGGPGGSDWSLSGGAGGGGGAVSAIIPLGANFKSINNSFLTISIGGGGASGGRPAGGPGGSNGGGNGASGSVPGGASGGGGGGGWSGVSLGFSTTYYVVAGGGSGGPGVFDTPFNFDSPAGPGGSGGGPGAGTPGPMNGADGVVGTTTPFSTTSGGGPVGGQGGGGGGQAGGAANSGGNNYINPILSNRLSYGGAAGQGAPGFLPANPEYSPLIPTLIGDANQPGIVVVSYRYFS